MTPKISYNIPQSFTSSSVAAKEIHSKLRLRQVSDSGIFTDGDTDVVADEDTHIHLTMRSGKYQTRGLFTMTPRTKRMLDICTDDSNSQTSNSSSICEENQDFEVIKMLASLNTLLSSEKLIDDQKAIQIQ